MDISTILVRIAGILLFAWTARSIYKHVKEKRLERSRKSTANVEQQSVTELVLNNILLYLWLAFMTIFSIGMVVNN